MEIIGDKCVFGNIEVQQIVAKKCSSMAGKKPLPAPSK